MRRVRALMLALMLVPLAAGCGGATTVTPEPETVEGAIPSEQLPDFTKGNPQAGKEVFDTAEPTACSTCHTFTPAGSEGELGPNLDESLQGDDAESIYQSIVNPDAELTEDFDAGVMPKTYRQDLTEQQLVDLVAFLQQRAS